MPYPDNISFAALDRATASAPEPITPRDITADERIVIARARAVQAALLDLRSAPYVSEPGTDAHCYRDSLQADGDGYCAMLIAAIEKQPQDEADRDECVRLQAEWDMEQ